LQSIRNVEKRRDFFQWDTVGKYILPKSLQCRNGCGQEIWFDWNRDYDDQGYTQGSSKPNIPLEVDDDGHFTGKKHDCAKSPFNQKKSSGSSSGSSGGGNSYNAMLQSDISAMMAQISQMRNEVSAANKGIYKIIKHFDMIDPNNDDGDSSRESDDDRSQFTV
jgi:hypothetical protein